MYKALIADDEEIIRSGLSRLLARDPDFEVAALAEDGEQALELAAERLPDLLLVDINMPFLNGLEFIERLEGVLRGAVIIVITGYDDFSYAQQALRLGVFDYLLKPVMGGRVLRRGRTRQAAAPDQPQAGQNTSTGRACSSKRTARRSSPPSSTAGLRGGTASRRWPSSSATSASPSRALRRHGRAPLGERGEDDGGAGVGREPALLRGGEHRAGALRAARPGDLLQERERRPRGPLLLPARRALERHRAGTAGAAGGAPARAGGAVAGPGRPSGRSAEAYDDAMELLEQREKCPQSVLEARRYIEERYADPGLSLQGAADRLHLSPQHLSRLFRHETGVTFVDYLSRVRIRRAVELLADGELKMYEIAERVGYSSQHYFSSAFKKVLGVSPMEYRRGGAAR